ncbi:MAG: hypothetical protein HDT32_05020 [Clostridiales bacterium]|nr:hypothetical protein [Clostridiales bacterium]
MSVKNIVQEILDNTLLQHGVLSHHLRHVKTDAIQGLDVKINDNEYVVYRSVSNGNGVYGDGRKEIGRKYVDVNYYYKYEKDDTRYSEVERRVEDIKKAFLASKRFLLKNDASDIYDIDNPYRGINVEFLFVEAVNSEQHINS